MCFFPTRSAGIPYRFIPRLTLSNADDDVADDDDDDDAFSGGVFSNEAAAGYDGRQHRGSHHVESVRHSALTRPAHALQVQQRGIKPMHSFIN